MLFRSYFYQIISSTNYIDIHRQLDKIWRSKNIDIRNNKYFIEFKNKMTKGLQMKVEIFNKSYSLGIAYIKLRSILKK